MSSVTAELFSGEKIKIPFGVVYGELDTLPLTKARAAVARAGIIDFDAPEQARDPFMAGVQQAFLKSKPEERLNALRILAEQFSRSGRVRHLFAQHGFEYVNDAFRVYNAT